MIRFAHNLKPVLKPQPMGCTVHVNRHGKLTFRLYCDGREFWEGIGADDTADNRRLAEAQAVIISDEIKRHIFDYLKWFPGGNKAHLFRDEQQRTERKTVRGYFERWIAERKPPIVRKSRHRDYRLHFSRYILPIHGDRYLDSIAFSHIRELRMRLIDHDKISVKTTRNIIDGSLRAFFRDAVAEGLISRSSPFDDQPAKFWPRVVRSEPDPFEEHERDAIIDYLFDKYGRKWRAGAVFTHALFWTGCRPSELTARRWRDLDLRSGKLSITSSRTSGEEGATKTTGSNRAIELLDDVLKLISELKPLRAQPNDYIFTQRNGRPINHWKYGERYFQGALTAKQIRHRDFYATRHTFISVMLSHGENLKQIADYVGSSPLMISTRYGKWIRGKGTFGQAAVAASRGGKVRKKADG